MIRKSQAARLSLRRLLVVTVLLLLSVSSVGILPAKASDTIQPFTLRSFPIYLIASYYNAITLKDYARAYSYWNGRAPDDQTLAQFTAGFADTESVRVLARLPIVMDGAAGTIHAEVPVVLFSKLKNGTEKLYAGCIHTALTNVPVGNATEPDPNWWLYSASLNPATSVDFVQASSECTFVESFPSEALYGNITDPVELLTSYYNAIASKKFALAYSYWNNGAPPNQTLQQFSAGFAGTKDIGVVIALTSFFQGAAAGNSYMTLPVLITAKHDDEPQLYVGCFTMHKLNVPVGNATEPDPDWDIGSATIQAVESLEVGVQNVWDICEPSNNGGK